jgi:hypothetical protein
MIGARFAPNIPMCDEAQMEAHFGPFGDSANLQIKRCTACVKRTIALKIVLDAPDGTHR